MIELSITFKNDEKKMTHKHMVYEKLVMDVQDPVLAKLIGDTKKEFPDDPTELIIKATLRI